MSNNTSGSQYQEHQIATTTFNNGGGANSINNNNTSNMSSSGSCSMTATDSSYSYGGCLKHNPGLSLDWTHEEQAVLEEALSLYAGESNLLRYAKIAVRLPNKTVRDVALRCRWMSKKENSKRRKEDNLAKKSKDRKERVSDPLGNTSQVMVRPNTSPYASSMVPVDNDKNISLKAIGGVNGELLEQNTQALNQVMRNLATFQLQDNISLLSQTRDNLLEIMSSWTDSPDLMKQMPPLPAKINEELANQILPPPNLHFHRANGTFSSPSSSLAFRHPKPPVRPYDRAA